ncbi:MAG: YdeI/OmpD-associated family protein [Mucilaginibacter polytrichastri]|nr:YdeI/OmpD-associated family protein [Mucilaginibacter polytrichastri]
MNPKTDFFFDKPGQWQEAYAKLRQIVLDCGLTEELKWGVPCYTLNGKNVVLIHGFKEYCALLFPKGALLKDEQGILIQQTENVQAARQVRFVSALQVVEMEALLKAYVQQAADIEKAGLKVELKKAEDFTVADEFAQKLNAIPDLKKAFEALTPGRRRAYLLYFGAAKQAATREARVEKYIPKILAGKGLDDE